MKFQYLHFRQPSSPQERLEENLRQASIAYIHTALQTYVKLEGKVSLWDVEKFGDSANVVSALHRGVEHLLKLRLAKLDLLLLYPLPRPSLLCKPNVSIRHGCRSRHKSSLSLLCVGANAQYLYYA